jgi:hemin uptake protein HemP
MAESRMNFVPPAPSNGTASTAAGRKPRIESQRLFQGNNEIVIVHHEQEYSLRITKSGKLILTK